VVEGGGDRAVVRRIVDFTGLPGTLTVHVTRGKGRLDRKLSGYNRAAFRSTWLVLRDLDRDADCAPELRNRLLPDPAPGMIFRVPVRSLESWLLADHQGIARFLGIASSKIPPEPETLARPKRAVVDLARQSRRVSLRRDMVSKPGLSVEVGPAYTARIIEFASLHWDPESAAARSDSLSRCLRALRRL
jgi:hypothetical protein